MQMARSNPKSPLFTRWLPSHAAVIRLLWMAVAGLHLWLVMRRGLLGDLNSLFDWLKALLCAAGAGYATAKVWRVATVFDSSPRRAWTFAFVVVLGHWILMGTNPETAFDPQPMQAPIAVVIAVVPMMGALALAVGALRQSLQLQVVASTPAPQRRGDDWLPSAVLFSLFPSLFRRPPPILSA